MTPGSEPGGIPQRVRVTSPRASAARARRVSIASEIDAQTQLGEVYITSLPRTPLPLPRGPAAVLPVTFGRLPLLFAFVPALRQAAVLGVPLPWILLTAVAFAEIIALGWAYVRRAERNEDDFSDLLEGR